jgi:branched-chain amino acid transport system permease protein
MDFSYLLQACVLALTSAAILLIATLGLGVVFGLMGVVNLAHGEFIMFGAYTALTATRAGLPFWLACVAATLATSLFGAAIERLVISRLYGRMLDTMLLTWGLGLVMYQCAVLIFGTVTPGIGMPLGSVQVGGGAVATYLLVLVAVAAAICLALFLILTRTGYGVLARAVVQDRTTASALGIDARKLSCATFALGSAFAGLAGAVLLPVIQAAPNMGFALAIKGFLSVVAAGPAVVTGTALSVLGLGASSAMVASYGSRVAGDLLFFGATMLLLRRFPQGISQRWRVKL